MWEVISSLFVSQLALASCVMVAQWWSTGSWSISELTSGNHPIDFAIALSVAVMVGICVATWLLNSIWYGIASAAVPLTAIQAGGTVAMLLVSALGIGVLSSILLMRWVARSKPGNEMLRFKLRCHAIALMYVLLFLCWLPVQQSMALALVAAVAYCLKSVLYSTGALMRLHRQASQARDLTAACNSMP